MTRGKDIIDWAKEMADYSAVNRPSIGLLLLHLRLSQKIHQVAYRDTTPPVE